MSAQTTASLSQLFNPGKVAMKSKRPKHQPGMDAFQQGYDSAYEGLPLEKCPPRDGTSEAFEINFWWTIGWKEFHQVDKSRTFKRQGKPR